MVHPRSHPSPASIYRSDEVVGTYPPHPVWSRLHRSMEKISPLLHVTELLQDRWIFERRDILGNFFAFGQRAQ